MPLQALFCCLDGHGRDGDKARVWHCMGIACLDEDKGQMARRDEQSIARVGLSSLWVIGNMSYTDSLLVDGE